jgi:hypothetical protein
MSDFKAIKLLKSLLKYQDRWELSFRCPIGFEDIGQKAKYYAVQRLSQLSLLFLWQSYKKWVKSAPILINSDDYFHAFMGDVAFSLACDKLTGMDRIIFEDNCSFTFKFISKT